MITPHPSQPTLLSPNLRRPPLNKLVQIPPRRHPQHKPPPLISNHGKILPLPGGVGPLEEPLQLLQRRVHADDLVRRAALAAEADHGGAHGVVGPHAPGVEQRLQVRDREVAEQGARGGVDDGQVGVVALEGGEEGDGDGVGGGEGEGRGGVEVLDCCLFGGGRVLVWVWGWQVDEAGMMDDLPRGIGRPISRQRAGWWGRRRVGLGMVGPLRRSWLIVVMVLRCVPSTKSRDGLSWWLLDGGVTLTLFG